jgi:hypothetical protein
MLRKQTMTCICKQYELYTTGQHTFETQLASYTCGPIAILNALRLEGRPTGPAVHRQIMVACNPKPRHADGFKGTKPADIERVIRRWWPDAIRVSVVAGPSILLYQRTPRTQHYVFVHRVGNSYHVENEADTGTTVEKDMTAYKGLIVWSLYDHSVKS